MATKKTSSSPGTTRSRAKKTASTNENTNQTAETQTATASSGGTAVSPAREKTTTPETTTPTTTNTSRNTATFGQPGELQDRIRQRAYELFQKRGGQHGFDIEDWLRAESEFKRSA